jgi:hypothetical protein
MRRWILAQTLVLAALVANACSTPAVAPTASPTLPPATEIPSPAPATATHAPAATPTPTPTFTTTSTPTTAFTATPTVTQAPAETDTPLPTPTATSVSLPSPTTGPPTATATPVLEPVTLRLRGPEPRRETVEAHRPVIGMWGWAVCNPEVMGEGLDAISFQITVDGSVVYTGDFAEQRSAVEEGVSGGGIPTWGTYWSYPMGAFPSGSFHWIEVEWRSSHAVTDGCDVDGDGQLDVYGPGAFLTQRLEVTVQ